MRDHAVGDEMPRDRDRQVEDREDADLGHGLDAERVPNRPDVGDVRDRGGQLLAPGVVDVLPVRDESDARREAFEVDLAEDVETTAPPGPRDDAVHAEAPQRVLDPVQKFEARGPDVQVPRTGYLAADRKDPAQVIGRVGRIDELYIEALFAGLEPHGIEFRGLGVPRERVVLGNDQFVAGPQRVDAAPFETAVVIAHEKQVVGGRAQGPRARDRDLEDEFLAAGHQRRLAERGQFAHGFVVLVRAVDVGPVGDLVEARPAVAREDLRVAGQAHGGFLGRRVLDDLAAQVARPDGPQVLLVGLFVARVLVAQVGRPGLDLGREDRKPEFLRVDLLD